MTKKTPLDLDCSNGAFLSIDELIAPSGKVMSAANFSVATRSKQAADRYPCRESHVAIRDNLVLELIHRLGDDVL